MFENVWTLFQAYKKTTTQFSKKKKKRKRALDFHVSCESSNVRLVNELSF